MTNTFFAVMTRLGASHTFLILPNVFRFIALSVYLQLMCSNLFKLLQLLFKTFVVTMRTPKPAALLSLWSIRDYFFYAIRPLKGFYRQPILQPCQKMFEFVCQTLNKEYMLLHIHKTQTYKEIVFETKLIYIMVFVPMCAEHPPFTTLILYIWNLYLF